MENNGIEDGFHVEEWRGGRLVWFGWHNGTRPSGMDATDCRGKWISEEVQRESGVFDESYKGES